MERIHERLTLLVFSYVSFGSKLSQTAFAQGRKIRFDSMLRFSHRVTRNGTSSSVRCGNFGVEDSGFPFEICFALLGNK